MWVWFMGGTILGPVDDGKEFIDHFTVIPFFHTGVEWTANGLQASDVIEREVLNLYYHVQE